MNLNITPEQKQKIVGIVVQGLLMMLLAILAVFGWNITIVQPQIAKQAAENAALAKQLADFKASAGIEPAKAEGIGALAVPYNVTTNPLFTKQSSVPAVRAWNGGDVNIYSDGGSTLKFSVDGATGNTYVAGFMQRVAGATVPVTLNATVTPLASVQPITSTAAITASTLYTTNVPTNAMVTLVNKNASNAITLTNSATLILPGASDLALGANDNATLWWDGSKWICIGSVNN